MARAEPSVGWRRLPHARSGYHALLQLLRAKTPAELEDPPDWERIDTVAWPKHRAAHALARFLGTDDRFRPDGSWQHQMDEAARLEQLLAEHGPVEAR